MASVRLLEVPIIARCAFRENRIHPGRLTAGSPTLVFQIPPEVNGVWMVCFLGSKYRLTFGVWKPRAATNHPFRKGNDLNHTSMMIHDVTLVERSTVYIKNVDVYGVHVIYT